MTTLTVSTIFLGLLKLASSSTLDLSLTNILSEDGSQSNSSVQCVLPLVPQSDAYVTPGDGIRFGNTPYSRQEFSKPHEFMYGLAHDSIFAMEFKTTGKNGVLFYVSAGCDRVDYIGLFMQEGKIVYVFDCGSGSAVISSNNTYNDGTWHRVVFSRQSQEGRLTIDDHEEVRGRSPRSATRVDELKSPFYVGGFSEELARKTKTKLQGVSSSFPGCIRNVEAQTEAMSPRDTQLTMTNVTHCSSKVEEGTFISSDGGYLVAYDKYYVGHFTSMTIDIKPRNLSGVVLAIHGKQDYLVLQLISGRVEFTMDEGAGPVTASYDSGRTNHLCDGRFHTIRVVRSNNLVTVTVDNVSSEPGSEARGTSSTDTFDPLYVGGLPESHLSNAGVRTRDQFVGCLRNLELNQELMSMDASRVIGHVTLNTCPTI